MQTIRPTSADIQTYLLKKLSEKTQIPAIDIDVNTPLIDMGLDSLVAADLNFSLKKEFNLELPFMSIAQGASIQQIVQELKP